MVLSKAMFPLDTNIGIFTGSKFEVPIGKFVSKEIYTKNQQRALWQVFRYLDIQIEAI